MTYDPLANVPLLWMQQRLPKICEAYGKIRELYWVRWEGGYKWHFGKKPQGERWCRPTLEQTIERQAIFDGVHKTLRQSGLRT